LKFCVQIYNALAALGDFVPLTFDGKRGLPPALVAVVISPFGVIFPALGFVVTIGSQTSASRHQNRDEKQHCQ
jgi:hypothetical protein